MYVAFVCDANDQVFVLKNQDAEKLRLSVEKWNSFAHRMSWRTMASILYRYYNTTTQKCWYIHPVPHGRIVNRLERQGFELGKVYEDSVLLSGLPSWMHRYITSSEHYVPRKRDVALKLIIPPESWSYFVFRKVTAEYSGPGYHVIIFRNRIVVSYEDYAVSVKVGITAEEALSGLSEIPNPIVKKLGDESILKTIGDVCEMESRDVCETLKTVYVAARMLST